MLRRMNEGRVAIITGASSGIGRDLAREAARNGYRVLAIARRAGRLRELAAQVSAGGGTITTLTLDVTQPGAAAKIVSEALSTFGRIDVVVNNAGSASAGALTEQSEAVIDAHWQLHVAAPLRITRAALPELRKTGGQAIFIGSGVAQIPLPYYGAYCAAKAAMKAMATQLRRELRGSGVAVTYIDPGTVRTEFGAVAGTRSGLPRRLSASSEYVAKRILVAMRKRPAHMNAVRWQGLVVALGGMFPRLADARIAKLVHKPEPMISHPEVPKDPERERSECHPEPVEGRGARVSAQKTFDEALEPLARRMERVNLSKSFVEKLLQPGAQIRLADAAMQWAGMPNKNERAALNEAMQALAQAGFLQQSGDESWVVLRGAHEDAQPPHAD